MRTAYLATAASSRALSPWARLNRLGLFLRHFSQGLSLGARTIAAAHLGVALATRPIATSDRHPPAGSAGAAPETRSARIMPAARTAAPSSSLSPPVLLCGERKTVDAHPLRHRQQPEAPPRESLKAGLPGGILDCVPGGFRGVGGNTHASRFWESCASLLRLDRLSVATETEGMGDLITWRHRHRCW